MLARDTEVKNLLSEIDRLKDGLVKFCSDLVRIPSVNPSFPGIREEEFLGGEEACNHFIAKELERVGMKVDLWDVIPRRTNLAGKLPRVGKGKSIALVGHIDTVPPGKLDDWTMPPYSGHVQDGRIYGRGAIDQKGGIAASIFAVKALQKAEIELSGDIVLGSVVGEETMQHEAGVTSFAKRGYKTDAAIVTESAEEIWYAQGGFLHMTLTVKGKYAHSFVRYELIRAGGKGSEVGVNAIDKAFKIYSALKQLEEDWGFTKIHPLLPVGHSTIGANVIRGGPAEITAPYLIPETCQIEYAIWYPPHFQVDNIKKEIEQQVSHAAQLDPWLRDHPPKVEWKLHWPPYEIDSNHPIIKTVAAAQEQVTGKKAKPAACIAVDDASFLVEAGVPAISYGPGGAGLSTAHAANEFVEIDDLVRAAKVFALSTLYWCS
nr:ArgE/DapE family deacylase [Candidatus Njordarchaeum guaymaensis]